MTLDGLPGRRAALPDVSLDAVIMIPGIMGTALRDGAADRQVWGARDVRWYPKAWLPGGGIEALALTPQELDQLADGTYKVDTARIRPDGILTVKPAVAPVLGGFEPYRDLSRRLTECLVAREALLEFGYDWRLPVAFNSTLLATAAVDHLTKWKGDTRLIEARRALPDAPEPKLVIVAHSMGGLVAHGLSLISGATDDVRLTITLGTPFFGSVKATVLLNSGHGAPLPASKLRDVAVTMPGVHDLLPFYRCLHVTRPDGVQDVVALTAADVESFGGNKDLAEAAIEHHHRLRTVPLEGHHALVGTHQETLQSLRLRDGVVEPLDLVFPVDTDGELVRDVHGQPAGRNDRGDGTVYRYAATPASGHPAGWKPSGVAQQHGALAKSSTACDLACNWLTDRGDLGIALGGGDIGLAVPEVVEAGTPFDIVVTLEPDPALVDCILWDTADDAQPIARPRPSRRRDGRDGLADQLTLTEPGVYRVEVKSGGAEPVIQSILCLPPGSIAG